jgi:hypothetical protein
MEIQPLPVSRRLAPRNDPRTIAILDRIQWIEPDGGLIRCTANEKAVGTDDDFVGRADADDAEGDIRTRRGGFGSALGWNCFGLSQSNTTCL